MESVSNAALSDPLRRGGFAAHSAMRGAAGTAVAVALVCAGYYAGGVIGLMTRFPTSGIATVWPATAVLLAALLLTPPRRWWPFLLALLPTHLHLVAVFQGPVPLRVMLLQFGGNVAQAVLTAAVLRRAAGVPPRLESLRGMALFSAVGGVAVPLAVSGAVAYLFWITGWTPDFWLAWRGRTLGSGLGALIVTPMVMWVATEAAADLRAAPRNRYLEFGLLILGLLTVTALAFGRPRSAATGYSAVMYAPLPLLLWAGVRFAPAGLCLAVFLVSVASFSNTMGGRGPFVGLPPVEATLDLQLFLLAVTVPVLLVAALTRERQQGESVLRRSEQRYRGVVETQNELVCRYLPDTTLTFVNEAYCRYFGRAREDLIGRSFLELIPEAARDAVRKHIESLVSDPRRAVINEHEVIRPDHAFAWQHWENHTIVDADGRVIELQAVGLDITARKQAEQALHQANDRLTRNEASLRLAMEAGRVGTFEMDLVSGRETWSEELERIGGLAPGTFGGTYDAFLALVHPEDRARVEGLEAQAVADGRLDDVEFRVVRPDGQVRWIAGCARALPGPDGGAERLLGVARDVTEEKQAEVMLRESEQRFRMMADSTPAMLYLLGPDGRATFLNRALLDFHGLTADQFSQADPFSFIHPDDRASGAEQFMDAFRARRPFSTEFRMRRGADGEYRWFFKQAAPRFAIGGEFLGYAGSCVDITSRKQAEVALREALAEVQDLKDRLHAENVYLREEISGAHNFGEILGHSEPLRKVLRQAEQVGATETTVLISGETGTGKELLARAVHAVSPRKDRPLIKVNCAALAANLIESELFGHERGAFTGASARRTGRFEVADGATIFLDEVGELPPEVQAKLLRVLQEGEFERLGSSKTLKVDVRVIAATNRDLAEAVRLKTFRSDLYYRLNVFPLTIPPLRERAEDIPLLAAEFAARAARRLGKRIDAIPPDVLHALQHYSWPGNVRELQNVVERAAVVVARGHTLRLAERLEPARHPHETTALTPATPVSNAQRLLSVSYLTLKELERQYIRLTLERTHWRIEGPQGAAVILGMNASTLRSRMEKLGLGRPASKGTISSHTSMQPTAE